VRGLVPLGDRGLRDDEVELGHVTGVFGFRGEVKVYLHNPESELLKEPRQLVLIAPDDRRFGATVTTRPGAGQRILAKIAEVADEAGASALKGYRLAFPKADLPDLEGDDEYYVWQLEGAEVRIDGEGVGRVVRVQQAGPHDVLEIDTGGGVSFVPVVQAFVVRIEAEARVVHLAPGALDELADSDELAQPDEP
jgi:16S rRNA processing protein RimM